MNDQHDTITKAKVRLTISHPFFGALALRYPCTERKDVPTMGTDGKEIVYNKEFVDKLSLDDATTIMAHETTHIAMLHHLRRGARDPQLFNVACDAVINPILVEAGFKMPAGAILDNRFAGLTAEKVYDMLMQDIRDGKMKVIFVDGSSMGGEGDKKGKKTIKAQDWGDVSDMPGSEDESVRQAEEAEMQIKVIQAAETAKSRGKLPSAFDGLLKDFRESKVNWRERIRTFVGGNKPDDWSYRRPNRKHMALSSVYLPTIEYIGAGKIVIGVDASGSVGEAEMSQFLGEIKAIHSEMRPEDLWVVWCDTEIHKVNHYTPWDEFDDKRRYACGGTYLKPVFDWVEHEGIVPDSLVFLSDLQIGNEMNGMNPSYPVLWVTTDQEQAPFGEVLKIKV